VYWLQTIDSAAFRFVNQSLANPVFDRLMPFLSGNPFFAPALVGLITLLLWRGGSRGRLCVAMLLLFVLATNNWVVENLKQLGARPRPFLQMPDVRLLVGRGGSHAMPSSHAANWFAATAMVWFYYRRTAAFVLLPLAILVSFSRIYNGVHYPSDVLAGALVGAAVGRGGGAGLDRLWRWVGQRWFPRWWTAFPSLTRPASGEAPTAARPPGTAVSLDQHWQRLGYAVIVVMLLFRLGFIASGRLELSASEASHWLRGPWSFAPTGGLSAASCLAWLGSIIAGDTEFGVRLFAPLIAAVISLVLLRWLAREAGAKTGVIFLLLATTTPFLALGAMLMSDELLRVLLWTAAMAAGWRAAQPDGTTSHWLTTGLWLGLGVLGGTSVVFSLACWILFLALWPPARLCLSRGGPWLALSFVLCAALEVTLKTSSGAHLAVAALPRLELLAERLVLLNPVWVVGVVLTIARLCLGTGHDGRWGSVLTGSRWWGERPREPLRPTPFTGSSEPRPTSSAPCQPLIFLVSMGVPWLLAGLVSWWQPGSNTSGFELAVLPLLCLLAVFWQSRGTAGVVRWWTAGLVLGGVLVVFVHDTNLVRRFTGHPVPGRWDPLQGLQGWRETARIAGEARRELEQATGGPAFIVCLQPEYTAEITFYLPEARRRRHHQPLVRNAVEAGLGGKPAVAPPAGGLLRSGDNAIVMASIETQDPEVAPASAPTALPSELRDRFASVRDLGLFNATYKDRPMRWFQMWECHDRR
jgi:membrane-associated phospholipid phosphatase